MVDGKLLIENLLCYACGNLHTAEEDCRFLRVLLYRRLGIVFVPSDGLPVPENNLELSSLYRELSTFVIENELVEKYKKEVDFEIDDAYVVSSIFGLITPLSSYLNRTFKTFREKLSAKKACDFFYETLENGAFIPRVDYIKAEVKDKQDKKESRLRTEIFSLVSSTGVPCRNKKRDNNYRYLTFEFEDRSWDFSYVSEADYYRHGLLTIGEKSIAFNSDVLDGVFDFCEYIPGYFAAARLIPGDGGYFCDGFLTGKRLPVFDAKTSCNLGCEKYPDVEIEIVDYPLPVLRLSSFNRNTLSSLSNEVIAAYKNKATQVKGEADNEGAEAEPSTEATESVVFCGKEAADVPTVRSVTVMCRIADDNRYSVDIVFVEETEAETFFTSPYDTLFKKSSPVTLFAGRFNLSEAGRNEVSTAIDVLTKKIDSSEYSSESALYNDVMKIIEENGFGRDAKKAEYEINERLYNLTEEFLSKKSAFKDDDGRDVPFKTFLAVAGIK